jgi:sialic acid synthase SpsE
LIDKDIFEDLFVLEMANNHLGSVERGLKIIQEFSQVVRFNNVRASIKLQFRDVGNFVHKDFIDRADLRYVKKTLDTRLTDEQYATLVKAIRQAGCIATATPFDERSVDLCVELGLPILKVASSDMNDWLLLEKIAKTKKPVVVSTGGSSLKDMDDIVTFFANRNIPLAINHCVSIYPAEDSELEINQIDFLREPLSEQYDRLLDARVLGLDELDDDLVCQGGADVGAAHRHRFGWSEGVAVLQPAAPDRRVVQGVPQGEGDVRRAGDAEAHASQERD